MLTYSPSRARAVIAIDDMRPEMTPYGHTHMHTPHLQKLADRSVVFSRAYVSVALCMPSRTALLTSRRPDTTRNWQISQQEFFRDSAAPSAARTSAAARAAWRTR